MFWRFTVRINCFSDLKIFANSQPQFFLIFSQSLEQFFSQKVKTILETKYQILIFCFNSNHNFPSVSIFISAVDNRALFVWNFGSFKWQCQLHRNSKVTRVIPTCYRQSLSIKVLQRPLLIKQKLSFDRLGCLKFMHFL